jgi:hypothetical protein
VHLPLFLAILDYMGRSHFALRMAGTYLLALSSAFAGAQSFNNPGFETGDFTGWSIALTSNGTTSTQSVVSYDIDGPGPLPTSLNAQFSVGRLISGNGGTEGVDLTQAMTLTSGVQYTFEFDWSAWRNTTTNNAEGGVFSVLVDGVLVSTVNAGSTSSTTPHYGHLTGQFTPTSTASYNVGARIARPFTPGGGLFQHVDNFAVSAVPEPGTLAVVGLGLLAALRRRAKK